MKKITLSILILSFSIVALAQTPGYLGRKLSLGLSINITPSQLKSNSGDTKLNGTIPYLNIGTVADLDIAVTRRSCIGFHYGFLYNSIEFDNSALDLANKTSTIQMHTHSLYFKWLKHRAYDQLPAPIGNMRGWMFGIMYVNAFDKEGTYPNKDGIIKRGKYSTVILPQICYTFNARYALNNRLYLNAGFNIGLISAVFLLPSLLPTFGDNNTFSYNEDNYYGAITSYTIFRAYKQNFINANVGISYLVF